MEQALRILMAIGIAVTSLSAQTAYFLVTEKNPAHGDSYILPLSRQSDIEAARRQLQLPLAERQIVTATIATGSGESGWYNNDLTGGRTWSWHVSAFLGFADMTIEILDGWPGYVERNLSEWIRITDGKIGFWNYALAREVLPSELSQPLQKAADHIPLTEGNRWSFSFTRTSGSVTYPPTQATDSGTVQWRVVSHIVQEMAPPRSVVKIEQIRTTVRRYGLISGAAFDSLYDPPRTVKEEITLTGCPDSNGMSFTGNPFWSFVHDPAGMLPDGMLDIRDTLVPPGRELIEASVIDPAPARSKIPTLVRWGPDYFITSAGIGPVGYYRANPPELVGAMYQERWRLREYSFGNTAVKPTPTPRHVVPARSSLPSDLIFDPRGRVCGRLERQKSGAGQTSRAGGIYLRSTTDDRVRKQVQVR